MVRLVLVLKSFSCKVTNHYAVWIGGAQSTLAQGFVLGTSRGGALGSPVGAGEDEVLDSGLSRPDDLLRPQASGWPGQDGQPRFSGEPKAAAHTEEDAEV